MAIRPPRYEFGRGTLPSALQSVTDMSAFGVVAVNNEGRFVYGNRVTEHLLGYNSFDLTSRNITQVVNADLTWVHDEFSFLKDEHTWNGQAELLTKDGRPRPFAVNAFASPNGSEGADYIAFIHPEYSSVEVGRKLALDETYEPTPRDRCLLQMLAEGITDKEIAILLGSSMSTINKEVAHLLQKMRVKTRTQACVMAIKSRLIL